MPDKKRLKELVFPDLADIYTIPQSYEDLENKPNIRQGTGNNILHIVDNEGNIIGTFTTNGLEIFQLIAEKVIVNDLDVEVELQQEKGATIQMITWEADD